MKKLILFLSLLVGCIGPLSTACHDKGDPYTHERPTRPFTITVGQGIDKNPWFADGGPTVLTVHNPTDQYRQLHVVCHPSVPPTYIDFGHHDWWTCMQPHQERWRLVEFMNVDALGQVCEVEQQYVSTPTACYEQKE